MHNKKLQGGGVVFNGFCHFAALCITNNTKVNLLSRVNEVYFKKDCLESYIREELSILSRLLYIR